MITKWWCGVLASVLLLCSRGTDEMHEGAWANRLNRLLDGPDTDEEIDNDPAWATRLDQVIADENDDVSIGLEDDASASGRTKTTSSFVHPTPRIATQPYG